MTAGPADAASLLAHGRWAEARSLAQTVLAGDAHHVDAIRVLAAAAIGEGNPDEADGLLQSIVTARPDAAAAIDDLIALSHRRGDLGRLGQALLARLRLSPEQAALWSDLGAAEERLGRAGEAARAYRRAIAADPGFSPALLNAATLAYRGDRFAESSVLALAAAAAAPSPSAWTMAGHALQRRDRSETARRCYRRSLVIEPAEMSAWEGLAALCRKAKENERVLSLLKRAATQWHDRPSTLASLSEAQRACGRYREALALAQRSVAQAPALVLGTGALAAAYSDRLDDRRAATWSRRSLHLDPGNGDLMINLGIALKGEGRLREAEAMLRSGLARKPDDANGHMALATTLLAAGRVREGFAEYEWRHVAGETLYDVLPAPVWDGRTIEHGSLLVWGEQGIGDEIAFIQLVRALRGRARHIVVECDPRLITILRRSFPELEFVGRSAPLDPRLLAPDIRAQIALLSLPDALGMSKDDLRSTGAYLVADPERVRALRPALSALGPRPRIGIAWRSTRRTPLTVRVHADLTEWEPILRVPGVTFVNLQYGDVDAEIAEARARFGVDIGVVPQLDLFQDIEGVLALGAGLDLVLASATSAYFPVAASGVESWQLQYRLAYYSFGDDADCLWPRARGFVREPGEDWSKAIAAAAAALTAWAADRRRA
ncbi:MAG: tetratricopeptide repeat protein [Alphaproteobacteria bacterium]|nr:tetratricopeptide repeat protein [Alphaproteobacteria bacterium]